jgi:tRNA G46 methylase TrmB
MPEDTAGPTSVPTRQRAEVDWNRGASGPQAPELPPVLPPARALLGNLPPQASGLILDLGCGVGSPAFEAARQNPEARVLGVDRANLLCAYFSFVIRSWDSAWNSMITKSLGCYDAPKSS